MLVCLRPVCMVAENQGKILTFSAMQLVTMSTKDNTFPRKLKFKITTKGIRNESENIGKVTVNSEQGGRTNGVGNKHSEVNDLVKPSVPANSRKRRPEMPLDGQREKKWKMDRNLKIQCGSILKELLNYPNGWVFNEPVDPVKLGIPDYFSIITEPMDLGTVKCKLERNLYFGAKDFAADVRLTFSNAMLYNPPGNHVHNLAKTLDGNFNRRWKLLEAKLKNGSKEIEDTSFVDYSAKDGQNTIQILEKNRQETKPTDVKKAPLRIKLGTYRTMSVEEKRKFRSELVQLFGRKMMANLRTVFEKFGLTTLDKERLDSYINSTDDETLWKLRREIKVLVGAKDGKVELPRTASSGCPQLRRTALKERCSQSACASANHRQSIDSTKDSSCDSSTHCQHKNGFAQACTSDITSETSSEHDHSGDSKLNCKVKYPLVSRTGSFGVDSDGPGVVLNEENSPHLSTPARTAASVEGWTALDVQMSPKKALRAAMLKKRFADTIFKATHQGLLDNGERSDPLMMRRERERLEREQQEERARIEAEMKAAEAASRRREQDDLKVRRGRERAAAKMALEMMERTVEIDENAYILKELEMMCCGSLSDRLLERLGLYIKDDYLEEDEDEDAVLNVEEGEILL